MTPAIELANISKTYQIQSLFHKKEIFALDNISLVIAQNSTQGIVGESGCGKSTLAKILLNIESPTSGHLNIFGKDISQYKRQELAQTIQMVFQDPYQSLNPRKKIIDIVADPLLISNQFDKKTCFIKATELLTKLGFTEEMCFRYPHLFSGGQRQRIGIARALILNPKILVLDEPVSALDVSIQAQILNLLVDLQIERNLTYLFISHDLSVVKHFCDEVLVMYLGKAVERGSNERIFGSPLHPYTQGLLDSKCSIQDNHLKRNLLQGELPSPFEKQAGCAFFNRCQIKKEQCLNQMPELTYKQNRYVGCHEVIGH